MFVCPCDPLIDSYGKLSATSLAIIPYIYIYILFKIYQYSGFLANSLCVIIINNHAICEEVVCINILYLHVFKNI